MSSMEFDLKDLENKKSELMDKYNEAINNVGTTSSLKSYLSNIKKKISENFEVVNENFDKINSINKSHLDQIKALEAKNDYLTKELYRTSKEILTMKNQVAELYAFKEDVNAKKLKEVIKFLIDSNRQAQVRGNELFTKINSLETEIEKIKIVEKMNQKLNFQKEESSTFKNSFTDKTSKSLSELTTDEIINYIKEQL